LKERVGDKKMKPGVAYAAELLGKERRHHALRAAAHGAGHVAEVGGVGAGGYYAGKKLFGKKEEDKEASAQFDIDAGNLAVEKAASVGWDADQAVERLNAILTLGVGDPSESEKVASAQSPEQALDARACELLEMAGYTINWA
jgi:hypothetical protein